MGSNPEPHTRQRDWKTCLRPMLFILHDTTRRTLKAIMRGKQRGKWTKMSCLKEIISTHHYSRLWNDWLNRDSDAEKCFARKHFREIFCSNLHNLTLLCKYELTTRWAISELTVGVGSRVRRTCGLFIYVFIFSMGTTLTYLHSLMASRQCEDNNSTFFLFVDDSFDFIPLIACPKHRRISKHSFPP